MAQPEGTDVMSAEKRVYKKRDKRRFVKLTTDGSHCIVHTDELESILAGEELETIEQSDVWMTEAEWEALPEFQGW